MKICVAQTKPVKGDIQSNIDAHKKLIDIAVSNEADTIIFPELSLTGYEPELAKGLVINAADSRLDDFQQISDTKQVTIGVGAPTKSGAGTLISLILFQPHQKRQTYSKKYLHADEEPFFTGGQNDKDVISHQPNMALAICYELSIPEHAENAFKKGADVYVASAVKNVAGIDKAISRLAEIAATYSMTVLLSNCVGLSGGDNCAGKTSIWNNAGTLTGQLNDRDEGMLMLDTDTQEVTKTYCKAGTLSFNKQTR